MIKPAFTLLVASTIWAGLGLSSRAEEEKGPLMGLVVENISQKLDYGLEANIEAEQWFSDERPTFFRFETMPELIWHYSPRYDFSIGYEREQDYFVDEEGNRFSEETNSGFVTATVKFPLKDWNISSRQMFEAGSGDEDENYMFRQYVLIKYDRPFLPFKLTPFVSNEYFLDLQTGEMEENRFIVGLSYPINEHFTVELFGMRYDQWMEDGESIVSPVVGLNLEAKF